MKGSTNLLKRRRAFFSYFYSAIRSKTFPEAHYWSAVFAGGGYYIIFVVQFGRQLLSVYFEKKERKAKASRSSPGVKIMQQNHPSNRSALIRPRWPGSIVTLLTSSMAWTGNSGSSGSTLPSVGFWLGRVAFRNWNSTKLNRKQRNMQIRGK